MYIYAHFMVRVMSYVFREIINLIETFYASGQINAVSVVKHVELRCCALLQGRGRGRQREYCSRARYACVLLYFILAGKPV